MGPPSENRGYEDAMPVRLDRLPGLGARANPRQNVGQSQPLPDLVADMDCSNLPRLFDFNIL